MGLASRNNKIQVQTTAEYLVREDQQVKLIFGAGIQPLLNNNFVYFFGGVRIKGLSLRMNYNISLSSLRRLGGNRFELGLILVGGKSK